MHFYTTSTNEQDIAQTQQLDPEYYIHIQTDKKKRRGVKESRAKPQNVKEHISYIQIGPKITKEIFSNTRNPKSLYDNKRNIEPHFTVN